MEKELNDCPICQTEPDLKQHFSKWRYECGLCKRLNVSPWGKNKTDAREKWNLLTILIKEE